MSKLAPIETHSPAPVKLPITAGGKVSAIVPRSIDEAFRLAEAFCIAGMVPDSYKANDPRETASRVMLGIMKGAEVGLPPVASLSNIYIVNKRPSVYGDGALAIVQAHKDYVGHKEWFEGEPGKDAWVAKCEFYRRQDDGTVKAYPGEFSWKQATNAQLTRKGPWVQYPERMLKMRARSFGLRDSFSDALCGLSIVEEAQDIPVKPESVDTGFLDAGVTGELLETVDWSATQKLFLESVAKAETQEALDGFLDVSEEQRRLMHEHAPGLWMDLDKAITERSNALKAD